MSPIAYMAWGCEFLLESSGAFLAFRKRLKILSVLLAWRAFMDAVTFVIFILHLHPSYGFTMWAGKAVQYALLYALGVQLAAKMIQDYRPITQQVYQAIAISSSVATFVFITTELWEHKFARAEAITGFLLIAVVLVGWIGRKKGLEDPWRMVLFGVVVGAVGNSLCAVLSARWSGALRIYPVPALIALMIWNWSVLPRKRMKLSEFRGGADQIKKPVTGVYRELSQRVQ